MQSTIKCFKIRFHYTDDLPFPHKKLTSLVFRMFFCKLWKNNISCTIHYKYDYWSVSRQSENQI